MKLKICKRYFRPGVMLLMFAMVLSCSSLLKITRPGNDGRSLYITMQDNSLMKSTLRCLSGDNGDLDCETLDEEVNLFGNYNNLPLRRSISSKRGVYTFPRIIISEQKTNVQFCYSNEYIEAKINSNEKRIAMTGSINSKKSGKKDEGVPVIKRCHTVQFKIEIPEPEEHILIKVFKVLFPLRCFA